MSINKGSLKIPISVISNKNIDLREFQGKVNMCFEVLRYYEVSY